MLTAQETAVTVRTESVDHLWASSTKDGVWFCSFHALIYSYRTALRLTATGGIFECLAKHFILLGVEGGVLRTHAVAFLYFPQRASPCKQTAPARGLQQAPSSWPPGPLGWMFARSTLLANFCRCVCVVLLLLALEMVSNPMEAKKSLSLLHGDDLQGVYEGKAPLSAWRLPIVRCTRVGTLSMRGLLIHVVTTCESLWAGCTDPSAAAARRRGSERAPWSP